jgi:hypothetical protein
MATVFLCAVPIKRCFLDEFKVKGTAVLPIGFEGRVINMLIKEFNPHSPDDALISATVAAIQI